jgi:predicted protein tyrosine phosphatase
MPTIYRVGRIGFESHAFPARPGFVAIRIADPGADFIEVDFPDMFVEHRLHFADVESANEPMGEAMITATQASQIANVLAMAVAADRDVVVHCNQGVYRSGAVCDWAGRWFDYINPGATFNTEVARALERARNEALRGDQWGAYAAQRNNQTVTHGRAI